MVLTKEQTDKIREGLAHCDLGCPDEIEQGLMEQRDACDKPNEWFRAENRLHIHRLESIVEEQKVIMTKLLDSIETQDSLIARLSERLG